MNVPARLTILALFASVAAIIGLAAVSTRASLTGETASVAVSATALNEVRRRPRKSAKD